uniref:ASCH domain-containing protein n=1 Tax=Pseudomonas phage HRDY3 TaxID=3236930 RepID=A0AB39CEL7_9VIRU
MSKKPNSVPYFEWRDQKIEPGTRIRIRSRHGSEGKGTVTDILVWVNAPDTICAEMDPDTEYVPDSAIQAGWGRDQERIADIGLFGGEIQEILKKN